MYNVLYIYVSVYVYIAMCTAGFRVFDMRRQKHRHRDAYKREAGCRPEKMRTKKKIESHVNRISETVYTGVVV